MKICMVIPFKYNWDSFSSTRSTYEFLPTLGHEVILFNRNKNPKIKYNNFDQVWLMGAGTKITKEEFEKIEVPVIAFGLSDPNLFDFDHFDNCDVYFTNDLNIYNRPNYNSFKKVFYNPTSCDTIYHKNLNLPKVHDILVYGVGTHKFILERNEIVNELRGLGFKIKVFGRGWDIHKDTYGFIEGKQLIKEINQSKIVLDITNKTTALGRRIFEASACGTPILTMEREDIKEMFNECTEIFLYNGYEQLVSKLQIYLQLPNLLKEIGLNAQKKCYQDHDISVRIQELLKNLKENGL